MTTSSYLPLAPPKVSVFMMAYNHAPYIAQALDSALAQQTTFTVEIVIGEDSSTDGTRNIVTDYVQRYPGRIRALLHETNLGASRNQVLVLEACTGEYIALLEGDDFWTDPYKLQKQVDFLDEHLDYAISAHNVTIVGGGADSQRPLRRCITRKPHSIPTRWKSWPKATCCLLLPVFTATISRLVLRLRGFLNGSTKQKLVISACTCWRLGLVKSSTFMKQWVLIACIKMAYGVCKTK